MNLISSNKIIGNIGEPLLKERFITSSITFDKRGQQQFFSELARQFYFERVKLGKDSYESFDYSNLNIKTEYSYSNTQRNSISRKFIIFFMV